MKRREFDALAKAAGLDAGSVPACSRVLVDGLSINSAARESGISPSTVSRMVRKIPRDVCKCCGGPIYVSRKKLEPES